MRFYLYAITASLAFVTGRAQQGDYDGGYQDYQDYGNYQDGYGQGDNLYADYADRQAQKAV
jgi:hypothetical protein